jgi:hypothetical protein
MAFTGQLGTSDSYLGNIVLGHGASTSAGLGAATLGQITASGSGTTVRHGYGAGTLQAIIVTTGTGAITVTGTGAASLSRITASAHGSTGAAYGNPNLQRITASASAALAVIGTGAATLQRITGFAFVESGIGAGTLSKIRAAGVGGFARTGHGAATLKRITASGSGHKVKNGTGAAILKRITASGSGDNGEGRGSSSLQRIRAAAVATHAMVGVGNATLSRVQAFANALPGGAASGTLKRIVLAAFGNTHSHIGVGHATVGATGMKAYATFDHKGRGNGILQPIRMAASGIVEEIFYLPITDDWSIHLVETITMEHFRPRNVNEHVAFLETRSLTKIRNNSIQEQLQLTETLATINNHYVRNISENLNLIGGSFRPSNIGTTVISLPEVFYSLVSTRTCQFVSLAAPATGQSIVLPTPEFGDTEDYQQRHIPKRSMTNVLYTYAKKNSLQKLMYRFVIGRPMALRLETFLADNIANVIDMQNWRGEIWKIMITNNPVTFTARSLFLNEGERYEVDLEFTGVRII